MDWNKRGAWLYAGSTPDYAKLVTHGIGTIYVDPKAGNAGAVLADAKARGYQAGIYEDPHWEDAGRFGGKPTPQQFAQLVSDDIGRLIPQAGVAPVMLDLEIIPIPWVQAFIPIYHKLRPVRETAYTNAPFQAPVVPVLDIANAGWHWYAQLYYGDMSPADSGAIMLEILRAGFPADRLHPFYDGHALPNDSRDGCVFTMERMPL